MQNSVYALSITLFDDFTTTLQFLPSVKSGIKKNELKMFLFGALSIWISLLSDVILIYVRQFLIISTLKWFPCRVRKSAHNVFTVKIIFPVLRKLSLQSWTSEGRHWTSSSLSFLASGNTNQLLPSNWVTLRHRGDICKPKFSCITINTAHWLLL